MMPLLNLILALIWAALAGKLTMLTFTSGFALGYLILWLVQPVLGRSKYFSKVPNAIGFTFYFLKELIRANLRVAIEVITIKHNMRPGIIAVPLDLHSDAGIIILANCITLTPGTLSIDVSSDRRVLYVHTMYVDDPDEFRNAIKDGFEKRIRELVE
jgi:multicomponent Na+:H+ antiporter subunit E